MDHLPECGAFQPFTPVLTYLCICAPIRACEARVTEGRRQDVADARNFGYGEGYAEALDAARDAVADIEFIGNFILRDDALAAIDALKEKS